MTRAIDLADVGTCDCACDERVAALRALVERVHGAFAYMPALNHAYEATATEVRAEVNEALSSFWADLVLALGQEGTVSDSDQ